MPNETNVGKPQTISEKRAIELINAMIDHMINDACGHSKEVIARLLDLGFTKEEMVDGFQFPESDVDECLESVIQDREVEWS